MKKLFSVFAATLVGISMFASLEIVPTDQDLANYYSQGQLCVCCYFGGDVCNDIVWAGTYNAWSTTPADMAAFEPVEGFDGWWVVAVDDTTGTATKNEIEGKPVQLQSDGTFSWDYQCSDGTSIIRGTVRKEDGYSGEINLKGYDKSTPVLLNVPGWKNGNSPCVVVPTHTYSIILKAPICADAEGTFFAPAIIGDFNGWAEGVPMKLNDVTFKYEYTIENIEEGKGFKFKATSDTDWKNQIQYLDETSEEWKDFDNFILPKATQDTTLEFDFGDSEKYRYTACGAVAGDSVEYTVTITVAPFCSNLAQYADSVQLVGDFDGWTGTDMTKVSENVYTLVVKAVEGEGYKVKAGTGWDVEPIDEVGAGLPNQKWPFDQTEVTLDLSAYGWKGCATAIDEVVFDKIKSTKLIIDGRLYIINDGVRYNAQGIKE